MQMSQRTKTRYTSSILSGVASPSLSLWASPLNTAAMTSPQDTTPTLGCIVGNFSREIRPTCKVFRLHRDGFRTRRDPWWLWVRCESSDSSIRRRTASQGRTHRPPSPTWPSLWTGKRASQTCRAYPSDPRIWICWESPSALISQQGTRTWRWSHHLIVK